MSNALPTDPSPTKPQYRRPSFWLMLRAVLFGALGFVMVPVAVAFLVLALAHIFDPHCGTPGDSGGCEMGAFGIGIAAAVPGFVIFFFITLLRGMRREARAQMARFTLDI